MRVETRQVYFADDGKAFDSEEACIRHERLCELAGILDGCEELGDSCADSYEIAKSLSHPKIANDVMLILQHFAGVKK